MNKQIQAYADLVVSMGINIKKGDYLTIKSPTECDYFVELLVKAAYEKGAKKVVVDFSSDLIKRQQYLNEELENFEKIDDYIVSKNDMYVKYNYKFISITAPDPKAFEGVDSKKIQAATRAYNKECKNVIEQTMSDISSWCVISVPTLAWAKVLYGDVENNIELLWEEILKATRCNLENPIQEWEKHIEKLTKVADFLNDKEIEKLHFKNSLGTDLIVGLPKDYIFMAAKSINQAQNDEFIANMPTEEVFTMPHNKRVDGKVYSSKPLNYNGSIIDEFYLEFKEGEVVNYGAKVGEEVLKNMLETDAGARRLGEVALVSYSSPINQAGILFYNTLFDENASCHLALGRAYPTCIKDGVDMDEETLSKNGANESAIHVDFMFGTNDMNVEAHLENNESILIFKEGEFNI